MTAQLHTRRSKVREINHVPLLSSYGLREWAAITVIAFGLGGIVVFFAPLWLLIPLGIVWLSLIAFFRDPPRTVPTVAETGPDAFISPADGIISAIERVESHDATGGEPAWVLRIFLSVFDVHINRMPCDAVVLREVYRPGRYHDARTPESARENENNLIVLERPGSGEQFGVRQIAGLVARRIVSRLEPGQRVARGERFGMLKFGSSTELILPRPDEVECSLQLGERVWCGVTVLAVLPSATSVPDTTSREPDVGDDRTAHAAGSVNAAPREAGA